MEIWEKEKLNRSEINEKSCQDNKEDSVKIIEDRLERLETAKRFNDLSIEDKLKMLEKINEKIKAKRANLNIKDSVTTTVSFTAS